MEVVVRKIQFPIPGRRHAAMICPLLCFTLLIVSAARGQERLFPDLPTEVTALDEPTVPLAPPAAQPEQLPQPADSPSPLRRLIRPTTPAAKMTIRRDPDARRGLGDDLGPGKSIRAVQAELEQDSALMERPFQDPSPRYFSLTWSNEPSYGRYLFIPHDPLLFEDIPAERYGESYHPCIQPVASFTKFIGTAAILPYKTTANYSAAKHEGGYMALDHHLNTRPGIVEGHSVPPFYLGAPYPDARGRGYWVEAATIAGVLLFLP